MTDILDFNHAVRVAADSDQGLADLISPIKFPDGFTLAWEDYRSEKVLFFKDERYAAVRPMQVEYDRLWEWESLVAENNAGGGLLESRGYFLRSSFQAEIEVAGWMEQMFSHAVRRYRQEQGREMPARPSPEEVREHIRELQSSVAQRRRAREEEEIAAGTRYRPSPPPWTAVHRHVHGTEKDDSIAGLGWDIEGLPNAPLRGEFERAADAHFAAAAWVMYDALEKVANRSTQPSVQQTVRAAMAAAMPLTKYETTPEAGDG